MIKWEYFIININAHGNKVYRKEFNELGQEGWEFIGFNEGYLLFKRPTNFMEIQNELREAWVEAIKATFAELFDD